MDPRWTEREPGRPAGRRRLLRGRARPGDEARDRRLPPARGVEHRFQEGLLFPRRRRGSACPERRRLGRVGAGGRRSRFRPAGRGARQFVSFVLDDAQATWAKLLPAAGATYSDAKLVLFRDGVDSACGSAGSSTGPFYCPGDQKLYIDLGFYAELKDRFGAPGDFAQAYVITHEIGHHVQHLLGIDDAMRERQARDPRNENAYSVALELQADCFAGIWGHETAQRGILERGDVEEGLDAAAAIGDDRMQKAAGRRVSPDAFTHGSSEQRVAWFRKGLETGDFKACDTFRAMR